MFDTIVDLLYDFCKENNLDHESADDILYFNVDKDGNNLTPYVYKWLTDYVKVWEVIA